MEELVKYLKALVVLQLQPIQADDPTSPKAEVLLRSVGLSPREIALLTGKTEAAVAKALSRANSSKKRLSA